MTVGTRRHCESASPKQSMFSVIPAQAGISSLRDPVIFGCLILIILFAMMVAVFLSVF
jgi:hypothetical protein